MGMVFYLTIVMKLKRNMFLQIIKKEFFFFDILSMKSIFYLDQLYDVIFNPWFCYLFKLGFGKLYFCKWGMCIQHLREDIKKVCAILVDVICVLHGPNDTVKILIKFIAINLFVFAYPFCIFEFGFELNSSQGLEDQLSYFKKNRLEVDDPKRSFNFEYLARSPFFCPFYSRNDFSSSPGPRDRPFQMYI